MANDNARQIVAPPTPMKITQIAVVVRDIEAALETYTQTLGWGPWSVFDYKPRCCTTRGSRASRSSSG